jgi:hypothetical protein
MAYLMMPSVMSSGRMINELWIGKDMKEAAVV